MRADGKPVEARGVINDEARRATVTLRGTISRAAAAADPAPSADGTDAAGAAGCGGMRRVRRVQPRVAGFLDGGPLPFEVVRTMGKREHTLRFSLGGEVYDGTLAQVQDQLDQTLRAEQLSSASRPPEIAP